METASDVLRKNCKQNEEANKKCIDFFYILNGALIYDSAYFVILFYAESCIEINKKSQGRKIIEKEMFRKSRIMFTLNSHQAKRVPDIPSKFLIPKLSVPN
jgi:hypothetical protein